MSEQERPGPRPDYQTIGEHLAHVLPEDFDDYVLVWHAGKTTHVVTTAGSPEELRQMLWGVIRGRPKGELTKHTTSRPI